MRLVVTGSSRLCCDLDAPLGGGVRLQVRIECDDESYARRYLRGRTASRHGEVAERHALIEVRAGDGKLVRSSEPTQ